MSTQPKTVLESVADRWLEGLPPHTTNEGGVRVHDWYDDARWFAAAYADVLRNEGHEIASDRLRDISRSKQ